MTGPLALTDPSLQSPTRPSLQPPANSALCGCVAAEGFYCAGPFQGASFDRLSNTRGWRQAIAAGCFSGWHGKPDHVSAYISARRLFLPSGKLPFYKRSGFCAEDWDQKITAINTRDLFHVHHHDGFNKTKSIMVKQNGPELKEKSFFLWGN